MYKNSNLQRSLTAAIGAVLVSFAMIGAAVGPAATPFTASGQVKIV